MINACVSECYELLKKRRLAHYRYFKRSKYHTSYLLCHKLTTHHVFTHYLRYVAALEVYMLHSLGRVTYGLQQNWHPQGTRKATCILALF